MDNSQLKNAFVCDNINLTARNNPRAVKNAGSYEKEDETK